MKIWDELRKQWRFMDGVVIICLILLSFTPLIVFGINQKNQPPENGLIAIIKIDGKEVDRFEINEKTKHFEKTYYPGKDKYNIIEMEAGRIRVKEDNSPDQIAVRTGWISRAGQTSICLPHKLVVELVSANPADDDDDDMIISY